MESLVNWYRLSNGIVCLHLQHMTAEEAQDKFRGQDFT